MTGYSASSSSSLCRAGRYKGADEITKDPLRVARSGVIRGCKPARPVSRTKPCVAVILGAYARWNWGWGFPEDEWLIWCFLVCLLQIIFRWRLERRDGRSGGMAIAHPLANVLLVVIILRSMFAVEVKWKGRGYVDGQANH